MKVSAANIFSDPELFMVEERNVIQELVQKRITGSHYFRTKWDLSGRIKNFDSKKIHAFLKGCAKISCDQKITSDPIKAFEKCASLLSLEQIEQALKTEHDSFDDALTSALEMVEKARYFIDTNGKKHLHPPLRRALTKTLRGIENTIETVLKAFGLIDFFSSPESEYEANLRVQKFMMLTTLLSGITTVILAVIGTPIASALVVGGLLLALAIFTALYVKLLKSTPSNLPSCTNLTDLANNGHLQGIDGRKTYMDKIANALKNVAGFIDHPLLVGPTNVGKIETIRAFAHAVARGDYQNLKGKKIFHLNCADIKKASKGGFEGLNRDLLERISKVMGKHRKNIILVLDKVHVVCRKKNKENLRSLLKDWEKSFPYVIATTTDKEYEALTRHNKEFPGRFKKISMPCMSENQDEVIIILNNIIIQHAPYIEAKEGVIRYLYETTRKRFPKSPEPYMSRMILTECIKKIEEVHNTKHEKELVETEEELNGILADSIVGDPCESPDTSDLSEEIEVLKVLIQDEKKDVAKLLNLRDKIVRTKKKLYSTTLEISKLQKNGKLASEKQLKSQLLLRYYLNQALVDKVSSSGMKLNITQDLVDEVMENVSK